MNKAATTAYLATRMNTTSQGEMLLMLYDAAIKFLKQAKDKIEARDYAAKGVLISRATDILSELNQSLNKERGGKLAQDLNALYLFCNNQLAQANLRMSTKLVDDVINILTSLRQAYGQIVPEQEGKRPSVAAPAQATPEATPTAKPDAAAAYPRPQLVREQERPESRSTGSSLPNNAQSRAASAYANSL